MRSFWRFGSKRRLVATMEWLRLRPNAGPFLQLKQTFATARQCSGRSARLDLVADGDPPARNDARPQPAAVHESAQDAALAAYPLELRAGLGQLDAHGLDAPDREAAADERVQVDSPGEDVAATLLATELDARLLPQGLERLRGDQGEVCVVVAVEAPPLFDVD